MSSTVPDSAEGAASRGGGARPRFGELASDALRYRERCRPLYNLALVSVVLVHFALAWPASREFMTHDTLFGFIAHYVTGNILAGAPPR